MDSKVVFTTGEVANLLHIHQTTVIDWMQKGILQGYKTPGGHRRVQREELMQFLTAQNMPVPAALRGGNHTPLIGVESEHHLHEGYQINPYAQGPATPNPHKFRNAASPAPKHGNKK